MRNNKVAAIACGFFKRAVRRVDRQKHARAFFLVVSDNKPGVIVRQRRVKRRDSFDFSDYFFDFHILRSLSFRQGFF